MTRKYNIINNSLGWLCFAIAAITYLLTLEPTASFWDCPEFISQGYKLEIGHPPGNPIFMLAARFFVNFAGGDTSHVALMVNAMSALLSAGTILLLFWTITHLVRRLIVGRSTAPLSTAQLIAVMGSGLCGALAYTWSDTFWFSAVEGEVYAFSSFCTALVFWLILKWDNRADNPGSDRYLILIAYIIGISIAVHLLNLLTIPALALVIYFRKAKKVSFGMSMAALGLSFIVIALILFGLVPGFVKLAGWFELLFVNTLGMGYNMGVLCYAVILVGVLIWCVSALYRRRSKWQIQVSFLLAVILSGIPFMGSGVLGVAIPVSIVGLLCWYLFCCRRVSLRLLSITALSILVIFVGYSSYALLLIRSHANPPMNQNAPDNVFALGSYLNREQYGETPLLYGPSFASVDVAVVTPDLRVKTKTTEGASTYEKVVKTDPSDPDRYVRTEPKQSAVTTPNTVFPRMYSTAPGHPQAYLDWIGKTMDDLQTVRINPYYNEDGTPFEDPRYNLTDDVPVPSFGDNLSYFFRYQLGYMYWRYFMWNFAGRQNDLQGQGELTRGNWITGIPFIDNQRLGDQSLLPPDLGSENKGHNVFYMLPLLMGLLGMAIQMVRGKEGLQQFWVVFFLFFMTGIAIVLYLNQPPLQVRERDYAFAGSFYAFAIWIGMGVAALWYLMRRVATLIKKDRSPKTAVATAAAAAVIGILVPLQMVSQTWDDHDRSGRYTTRDFGMNYLSSLDPGAVIFTNGDNDTFPLWYAQEVEGYRTDVRVVNLAYLGTPWYVNQMRVPSYDATGLPMQAVPADYALDRLQVAYTAREPQPYDVFVSESLDDVYHNPDAVYADKYRTVRFPRMYMPANTEAAIARGIIPADYTGTAGDAMEVDLSKSPYLTLSNLISLDIINTGITNGWERPAYFAMTVPDEYYLNLTPYLKNTGLAYQVTPARYDNSYGIIDVNTDKMYDIVTKQFRWGGLDTLGDNGSIYLDETVRRMVTTHRSSMLDLAEALYYEGEDLKDKIKPETPAAQADSLNAVAAVKFDRAVEILDLMMEKLPVRHAPFAIQVGQRTAALYNGLAVVVGEQELRDKALSILEGEILRYAPYVPYYNSLINNETQRRYAGMSNAELTVIRHRNDGKLPQVSLAELPLTAVDRYAPQYLYNLLSDYMADGGDTEVLTRLLDSNGISLDGIENMISYGQ